MEVIGGSHWTNALYVPFFAFVSSRLSLDLRELGQRLESEEGTGSEGLEMAGLTTFGSLAVNTEMRFVDPAVCGVGR